MCEKHTFEHTRSFHHYPQVHPSPITYFISGLHKLVRKEVKYTKYTGNKAKLELRGEESEKPGRGVQAGTDLVLLQVSVQVTVIVVQQSGQLVHLDLQRERKKKKSSHLQE